MRNLLKIWVCAFAFIMLLPFSSNAAGKKADGYNIIVPKDKEGGIIETDKVTAKKNEKVTITITCDDGYRVKQFGIITNKKRENVKFEEVIPGNKYTFIMPNDDVRVLADIFIYVESISIDSDLELEIGEIKQLVASIKPETAVSKKINWSTDNDEIVTVDNGLVTGVSKGTAVITVKCEGKRAKCKVTVKMKMAKPTDTVQYLPAGTDGTIGPEGTYVLFGDWPQTVKAKDVEIDETISEVHGDFTYYAGSDGNWYIKYQEQFIEESPGEFVNYRYSDGTMSADRPNNSYKYFKVEPIKWRVLNPNAKKNEKKIILAEEVIIGGILWAHYNGGFLSRFEGKDIYDNNYEYSNIRAYLNGIKNLRLINAVSNIQGNPIDWTNKGFYNTAFTQDAQNLIANTLVDNSSISANPVDNPSFYDTNKWHNPYGSTTTDKIFLPGVQELTKEEYGFNKKSEFEDSKRKRHPTDFAKANKVLSYDALTFRDKNHPNDNDLIIESKGTYWFTRSPSFRDNDEVHVCDLDGFIGVGRDACDKNCKYGYVPALCLE